MPPAHADTASKQMPANNRTATTHDPECDDSSLGLADLAFMFDEDIFEVASPSLQVREPTQRPNLETPEPAARSKSSAHRVTPSPSDVTLFPFLESRALWGLSLDQQTKTLTCGIKTAGATPSERAFAFR
ncbi:hypothetical protein T484DRAFT_1910193 [Baffinella frigidus]|nr:hypothetical protein T484DRAFT_1910193 [Cryptophyta sp. CCMP2293]